MKTGPRPHSTTGSKNLLPPSATGRFSKISQLPFSSFFGIFDWLHAVVGGQSFLERLGKLLGELRPALFPNLVLETVQDLSKHILQVRLDVSML